MCGNMFVFYTNTCFALQSHVYVAVFYRTALSLKYLQAHDGGFASNFESAELILSSRTPSRHETSQQAAPITSQALSLQHTPLLPTTTTSRINDSKPLNLIWNSSGRIRATITPFFTINVTWSLNPEAIYSFVIYIGGKSENFHQKKTTLRNWLFTQTNV